MTLTLDIVRRILDAAVAEAHAQEVRLSFAVVDAQGHDLGLLRMEGAVAYTAGIARAKAQTAALMRRDSGELSALFDMYPDLRSAIQAQVPFPMTTLVGGAAIWVEGTVIGGIGGSGAAPEVDLACARAGLAAVGLAT